MLAGQGGLPTIHSYFRSLKNKKLQSLEEIHVWDHRRPLPESRGDSGPVKHPVPPGEDDSRSAPPSSPQKEEGTHQRLPDSAPPFHAGCRPADREGGVRVGVMVRLGSSVPAPGPDFRAPPPTQGNLARAGMAFPDPGSTSGGGLVACLDCNKGMPPFLVRTSWVRVVWKRRGPRGHRFCFTNNNVK